MGGLKKLKLILPTVATELQRIWGNENERSLRNKLNAQALSKAVLGTLENEVDLRLSKFPLPQSIIAIKDAKYQCYNWALSVNNEGLGLSPGNALGLIQVSENSDEFTSIRKWFEGAWESIADEQCQALASLNSSISCVR